MDVYYHDIDKIKNKTTISHNNMPNISRDKQKQRVLLHNDVAIIENLNNNDYDLLLSKNIVFINLINASAVNTIIECIVRNTPIIVNRLPATVELLGELYPLFYNTIADATDLLTAKKIKEGWSYLNKMDKTEFKIETFISKFI